jgi:hypothetical protein
MKVATVIVIAIPVLIFLWVALAMLSFMHTTKLDSNGLRGSVEAFHERKSIHPATGEVPEKQEIRPNHLILLPGHAALHVDKLAKADFSDDAWYLLSYQKNKGYPKIITSHILKSIDLATQDPNSAIIFSGGETRHDVGPLSEAASYYFLAEYKGWISKEMTNHIYLEEYARDSFENLMFSICRFYEVTNNYPEKITVVGFDFKESRYSQLHRKAIHYPESSFTYIGLHAGEPFDQVQAEHGEKEAFEEFSKDFYGCNDRVLHEKRIKRNPFHRSIPYELSCPDMKTLLEWCGPDLIDSKFVPWAK